MLRFEYSGHGSSEGQFTDGTIGQWLRESLAILREVAEGPQILTGSSMGAWLVLLILRAIADQTPEADGLPPVVGAVQIAPSFDMTEDLMWNIFSDQARQALETEGYCNRTSRYDDDPYRITRTLIEEGRNHLIGSDPFELPCPVHIIHGIDDPDVPWQHANRLTFLLLGNDVTTYFIQKGDHRLSRPHEIEKMLVIIEDLYRTAMKNKVHI
jgi:pimeloyl-ACP methyl ester carboxylesterase